MLLHFSFVYLFINSDITNIVRIYDEIPKWFGLLLNSGMIITNIFLIDLKKITSTFSKVLPKYNYVFFF